MTEAINKKTLPITVETTSLKCTLNVFEMHVMLDDFEQADEMMIRAEAELSDIRRRYEDFKAKSRKEVEPTLDTTPCHGL